MLVHALAFHPPLLPVPFNPHLFTHIRDILPFNHLFCKLNTLFSDEEMFAGAIAAAVQQLALTCVNAATIAGSMNTTAYL